MVENNGDFPREAISTLCHLARWSEKGGTWALYIKESMARHLDSSAYTWIAYTCQFSMKKGKYTID